MIAMSDKPVAFNYAEHKVKERLLNEAINDIEDIVRGDCDPCEKCLSYQSANCVSPDIKTCANCREDCYCAGCGGSHFSWCGNAVLEEQRILASGGMVNGKTR